MLLFNVHFQGQRVKNVLVLTTLIFVSTSTQTEKQTLETWTQSFPQKDSFLLLLHRQAALQFSNGRNNKRRWSHPFHFRLSSSPLLRLTKLELLILMWLLHNSRWGPNCKNGKEKDGKRGKMFGTFDFIANLMGLSFSCQGGKCAVQLTVTSMHE